ncbi:MAG: N-acetyl-gamma-glutamyl-phosphate reductase [Rhizobiales bacterium]|nr:N-acetyl-gamma-glutamyl-phosphate reductase [Hyphomicrobiales bacterium]
MTDQKIRIGVLGASGYTGADLVRLAVRHPNIEITVLTANAHAGKPMEAVFPHLRGLNLPDLVKIDEADWSAVDAVFCGLPHGTTQQITANVLKKHPDVKFIDMSADFRLRDADTYQQWYGNPHVAMDLQKEAVYGLTEHYGEQIAKARLVACPGCYPTAVLNAMLPLVSAKLIDPSQIIIDAKSGVSGAGRGLKQNTLFCETGEGMSPYAVGTHRHAPEIEQEIGVAGGQSVAVSFTPHLIPMSRGELCTHYVSCTEGASVDDLRNALAAFYADKPFVHVLNEGEMPATQHVRGSNNVLIGVFADRIHGRAIVISALDNLIKGSAGQALQNFNLMFGLSEMTGLKQVALFP